MFKCTSYIKFLSNSFNFVWYTIYRFIIVAIDRAPKCLLLLRFYDIKNPWSVFIVFQNFSDFREFFKLNLLVGLSSRHLATLFFCGLHHNEVWVAFLYTLSLIVGFSFLLIKTFKNCSLFFFSIFTVNFMEFTNIKKLWQLILARLAISQTYRRHILSIILVVCYISVILTASDSWKPIAMPDSCWKNLSPSWNM